MEWDDDVDVDVDWGMMDRREWMDDMEVIRWIG